MVSAFQGNAVGGLLAEKGQDHISTAALHSRNNEWTRAQCLRFVDVPYRVSCHTENNGEQQEGRREEERNREFYFTHPDCEFHLDTFLGMCAHLQQNNDMTVCHSVS